jgi:hypothetical protein
MPIIGISLEATREYESKFDPAKGTPEATKFKLGTIDSRISGRLKDQATSIVIDAEKGAEEVTTNINSNEVAFNTVVYGLKGWENFKDGDGNDIKFKQVKRTHGSASYRVVDPELVKILPQSVIQELSLEIDKANDLAEAEAKN